MYWSTVLILVPFLGAALVSRFRSLRSQALLGIAVGAVGLLASFMNFLPNGGTVLWKLNSLGLFEPAFRLDGLSALFSLFTAFVWLASSLYVHTCNTKAVCFRLYFLTLGALQEFLGRQFVTLLFSLRTVTSFFWVIPAIGLYGPLRTCFWESLQGFA